MIALLATAAGALWFRVALGRTEQVLPWQGAILSLYAFTMAAACADRRAATGWVSFGLLILAAFTRVFTAPYGRLVGVVEVACCVALLLVFRALARDPRFGPEVAVLRSGESHH